MKVKSLSHVGLCDPMDCGLPGSSIHGIFQARVLEWGAILLQGIFPTQGWNPGLPHCRQMLSRLSHQGSPGGLLRGQLRGITPVKEMFQHVHLQPERPLHQTQPGALPCNFRDPSSASSIAFPVLKGAGCLPDNLGSTTAAAPEWGCGTLIQAVGEKQDLPTGLGWSC